MLSWHCSIEQNMSAFDWGICSVFGKDRANWMKRRQVTFPIEQAFWKLIAETERKRCKCATTIASLSVSTELQLFSCWLMSLSRCAVIEKKLFLTLLRLRCWRSPQLSAYVLRFWCSITCRTAVPSFSGWVCCTLVVILGIYITWLDFCIPLSALSTREVR